MAQQTPERPWYVTDLSSRRILREGTSPRGQAVSLEQAVDLLNDLRVNPFLIDFISASSNWHLDQAQRSIIFRKTPDTRDATLALGGLDADNPTRRLLYRWQQVNEPLNPNLWVGSYNARQWGECYPGAELAVRVKEGLSTPFAVNQIPDALSTGWGKLIQPNVDHDRPTRKTLEFDETKLPPLVEFKPTGDIYLLRLCTSQNGADLRTTRPRSLEINRSFDEIKDELLDRLKQDYSS